MIKTTIEWYALDEKLPFDGKILRVDDKADILCVLEFAPSITIIESLKWLDKEVVAYDDGEWCNITHMVKYWAYVPEIGVE